MQLIGPPVRRVRCAVFRRRVRIASRLAPTLALATLLAAPCGRARAEAGQNAAQGSILYASVCAGCHGPNAAGDAARHIPALAGRPAADLIGALRTLRVQSSSTAAAPGTASLHAKAMGLLNTEQLADIAAYLSALVPPPAVSSSGP